MFLINALYLKYKSFIGKINKKTAYHGIFLLILIAGAVFLAPMAASAAQPDLGLQFAAESGLSTQDIRVTIAKIIRVFLGLLGIIAVVIVLYGGFVWMTAGGDAGKVDTAKKILINGTIGLAIIASAYAITQFILSSLLGAAGLGGVGTGTGPGGPGGVGGIGGFSGGGLGTVIESHYPYRGQVDVARNTKILITFHEEIADSSIFNVVNNVNKINTANVKIYKTADGANNSYPIDATKILSDVSVATLDSKTYVFTVSGYLGSASESVSYTVFLTSGITKKDGSDLFSTRVPDYSWQFSTGTTIDIIPPKIQSVSPVDQTGCVSKCVPRNKLVQITFSEPVDPTTVIGTVPGFNIISLNYTDGTLTKTINGKFSIDNQYRTVVFMPSEPCDATGKQQNSCGEQIFCMPGEKKITGQIKAATLDTQAGGSIASYPYSGVVDLAGNSLDGNADAKAQGPSSGGDCFASLDAACASGKNCCTDNDNFVWFYNTSNTFDLEPPQVIAFDPDYNTGNVDLAKNAEITFNKPLMANSLWGSVLVQYYIYNVNTKISSPLQDWGGAQSTYLKQVQDPALANKILVWHHYDKLLASTTTEIVGFVLRVKETLRDDAQNCYIGEEKNYCQRATPGQFFPNSWSAQYSKTPYPGCDLTK